MSAKAQHQKPQTINKLEAARRQLATAVDLWFYDKDDVSIHTLSFAAYEVIHIISKKSGRRRDLLFDSIVIKDEYRKEFNDSIRKFANFFKHADRDSDATIDFQPLTSEMFILFSILGLETMSITLNEYESAFMMRLYLVKPHLLTKSGHKFIAKFIPTNDIENIRNLPKSEFFQIWLDARRKFLLSLPHKQPHR